MKNKHLEAMSGQMLEKNAPSMPLEMIKRAIEIAIVKTLG